MVTSSCAGDKKQNALINLEKLLTFDVSWQKAIDQNILQHSKGEDFNTKELIDIDLYDLVKPLTQNNLKQLTRFVAKNNTNINDLVGVALEDFVQGAGEFNIENFVNSKEFRKFLPGGILGEKDIRNYLGFLIGVSKGKISPNLLVVMYYTYGQTSQLPEEWSNLFDKFAILCKESDIAHIAPLSVKTKEQNLFLQTMNLSLSQNPKAFAQTLDIITKSGALKNAQGLKYLIDDKNESVLFFSKLDVSKPLVAYYPFAGVVVMGNTTTSLIKVEKVELKPIYQVVKNRLIKKDQ